MTQAAHAMPTILITFCKDDTHVVSSVVNASIDQGWEIRSRHDAYRVDLGCEMVDVVGAAAEIIGDAAGDEEAQGRGHAIADGSDQAQHHQRHVHRVRVREHRRTQRQRRGGGLLRPTGVHGHDAVGMTRSSSTRESVRAGVDRGLAGFSGKTFRFATHPTKITDETACVYI